MSLVGPLGFEPRIANAPGLSLTSKTQMDGASIDWEAFREWLSRDHRPYVVRDYVNYCKRFSHCLLSRNLKEIQEQRVTLRSNVVKSLSSLSKFLGIYEEYKALMKTYGINWQGKSADDLMIDRLTKTQDPGEVFAWIREVKQKIPELTEFMDFIAVTGLRLQEAISSFNLVRELSQKGKLGDYYKAGMLEHFRFKEIFIRKSKKAFVSYVPEELIARIQDADKLGSKFSIQLKVKRHGIDKIRFADVRENHASFMTKYLKPQEIDFLHGRIGTSVFMQNYYNPSIVEDLKARAFQGIAEIQTKISELPSRISRARSRIRCSCSRGPRSTRVQIL